MRKVFKQQSKNMFCYLIFNEYIFAPLKQMNSTSTIVQLVSFSLMQTLTACLLNKTIGLLQKKLMITLN